MSEPIAEATAKRVVLIEAHLLNMCDKDCPYCRAESDWDEPEEGDYGVGGDPD